MFSLFIHSVCHVRVLHFYVDWSISLYIYSLPFVPSLLEDSQKWMGFNTKDTFHKNPFAGLSYNLSFTKPIHCTTTETGFSSTLSSPPSSQQRAALLPFYWKHLATQKSTVRDYYSNSRSKVTPPPQALVLCPVSQWLWAWWCHCFWLVGLWPTPCRQRHEAHTCATPGNTAAKTWKTQAGLEDGRQCGGNTLLLESAQSIISFPANWAKKKYHFKPKSPQIHSGKKYLTLASCRNKRNRAGETHKHG